MYDHIYKTLRDRFDFRIMDLEKDPEQLLENFALYCLAGRTDNQCFCCDDPDQWIVVLGKHDDKSCKLAGFPHEVGHIKSAVQHYKGDLSIKNAKRCFC
jgi:hypothetical protein